LALPRYELGQISPIEGIEWFSSAFIDPAGL
jgi:hypothetical protein